MHKITGRPVLDAKQCYVDLRSSLQVLRSQKCEPRGAPVASTSAATWFSHCQTGGAAAALPSARLPSEGSTLSWWRFFGTPNHRMRWPLLRCWQRAWMNGSAATVFATSVALLRHVMRANTYDSHRAAATQRERIQPLVSSHAVGSLLSSCCIDGFQSLSAS